MTHLLALIAAAGLGADAEPKGLPFGIPPAADDPVVTRVAPPECLFYANWAGTAAPSAASRSETEKLLAEPEVQEFIKSISKVIGASLKKQDENSAPTVTSSAASPAPPPLPNRAQSEKPAALSAPTPNSPYGNGTSPATAADSSLLPAKSAEAAAKPGFRISAQDYGDWVDVLLTHSTAIFITDIKVPASKPADDKSQPTGSGTEVARGAEIRGGMVVSLGEDAARIHAKAILYYNSAKKLGADHDLQRIEIDGEKWIRTRKKGPGDANIVTFGFHDKCFVVGFGDGAVEAILARWHSPGPEWLIKALRQTAVPRRTGIVYLNLKAIHRKMLATPSMKESAAAFNTLGLDAADTLVSTTGLEDDGMINRVLLSFEGDRQGLLAAISDRPLVAKDLAPIPHDALMALAAKVDLSRALKTWTTTAANPAAKKDENAGKSLDDLAKEYGINTSRCLAALGDSCCIYNSPAEGEFALCGWTIVVPVRDKAVLRDACEKLCAAAKQKAAAGTNAGGSAEKTVEFRKYNFAGYDIYYLTGQAAAPAITISDREMVMTLNLPAMKSYLSRKNHRPLTSLPGVQAELNDAHPPAALACCDTPRLFNFFYPVITPYAIATAAAARQSNVELEPTFWPSATALRSHLKADITTLRRTPHGLELTCRYCLPSGGAAGPMWLVGMSMLGSSGSSWNSNLFSGPMIIHSYSGDPTPATQEAVAPSGSYTAANPYATSGSYPAYGAAAASTTYPASAASTTYPPAASPYPAASNPYAATMGPAKNAYAYPAPAADQPAASPGNPPAPEPKYRVSHRLRRRYSR